MPEQGDRQRIKFDFPEVYVRAIRVRAGFDGVHQRDVVLAALDQYLAKELEETRARLALADTNLKQGARKVAGRKKNTDSEE